MWSAGIQKRTGTRCSVRGARRLADRIREAKVPAGSRLVVSCVMAIVSLLYLDGEHGHVDVSILVAFLVTCRRSLETEAWCEDEVTPLDQPTPGDSDVRRLQGGIEVVRLYG